MPSLNAQCLTYSERHPSLVSVDGRIYPLKSVKIDARAEGGIAATTLTQTYENPYADTLEVFYTLPLPADGAVIGYTIKFGKRIIRGEVRKREEASEEYRKALFEGRTAALLEQEREDTFSQKLGSLPPGETVRVEIEVLQALAFLPADRSGQSFWEYRFPTVVGVRYEGGKNRVSDRDKLDVDRALEGTPARLDANLLIADGCAGDIRPHCPHGRIVLNEEGNGTKITFDGGMSLDRDLVIRWSAAKQSIGVGAVEGKGLPGDDGRYIMITLTPPVEPRRTVSRDLTLLIDASGSMSGRPIEQAKAVASELLHSLSLGDRFEILAFSNNVRRLIPGPVDADSKSIERALMALGGLQGSGSTEMTGAIVEALKPLRPGSQRQIILISDGYIGFEGEVIGEIHRKLVPGARVHCVGVGSAPNRSLTQGAARAGRGIEILIGLEENAASAAERLLHATVQPILTDISVRGSGLVSFTPQRPRDVLAGQPLLLFAELKQEGGKLEIRGSTADKSSPWMQTLTVPGLGKDLHDGDPGRKNLSTTSLPIGALFGRKAIEDAEMIFAAECGGRKDEIEKLIESLGLRHRITSRMTSLFAVSEDTTVDPRDPRRQERLPVEVPAGVSAEGAGLMPYAAARALPGELHSLHELAMPMTTLGKFWDIDSRVRHAMTLGEPRPSYPIVIDETRVLNLDGQVLVFEFEVPVDGFMLPDKNADIHVLFDDSGESGEAQVLKRESSKPGPHRTGLTVRLALQLKGQLHWDHREARIHWDGKIKRGLKKSPVRVELHLMLTGVM